jgi:hypothetical protein
MEKLLDLVFKQNSATWSDEATEAFKSLFGAGGGRYEKRVG